MNNYDGARKSGWTKNRFRIGNLSIISFWGDRKPLPDTVTVNLTPNTAWSLGTEIDLPTLKEDDLALKLEPDDIHCDNNEDDDETTGGKTFDDETGLSGSNPPENDESETSAKRQPDKQNEISDPMGYFPNKKELEKPPRPLMSNSDIDAGPLESARTPS